MTTQYLSGRDIVKTLLPFLTTPPYSPFLIFVHKPLIAWRVVHSHIMYHPLSLKLILIFVQSASPPLLTLCIHVPSLKPWYMTRCSQLWRAMERVWTVCVRDMWPSSIPLYTSVVGARNLIIHCYTMRANLPNLPLRHLKSQVKTPRLLPSSLKLCSLKLTLPVPCSWQHSFVSCHLIRTLLKLEPYSTQPHQLRSFQNVFHSISSFYMWSSLFRLQGLLACHMSPVVNQLSSFRSHQHGHMGKCSTWN